MSDIEQENEAIITETEPNPSISVSDNEVVPLEKPAKPKKPRTEKQMEAFRNAAAKRAANIASKKAAKVADKVKPTANVPVAKPTKQAPVETVQDDSDSDEEIVIRRKPATKPKKKIYIELSSSDESEAESKGSDSDSELSVEKPMAKSAKKTTSKSTKFASQLNKKHSKKTAQEITFDRNSYFCD